MTSNSVDLRIRKYLEIKDSSMTGSNMYPFPGGLAVKVGNSYMKIFPEFSLGVEMVSNNSFEILMHRNLNQDDDFGLAHHTDDRSFVNFHFEVELGELSQNQFQTSYIEIKSKLQIF